jgi:hypothetical protein
LLPDACLRLAKTFREMHHLAAFALIRYSSSRLFAKLRDRDAHCLARTARTPQSQEFSSFEVRVRSTRRRVARCRTPHAARVTLSSARMWESSCRQLDHQTRSRAFRRRHAFPSRTPRTRARPGGQRARADARSPPAPPFALPGPAADPRPALSRLAARASARSPPRLVAWIFGDFLPRPSRLARTRRPTDTDTHRHTHTHTHTTTCPASAGPAFPRAPSR